MSTPGDDTADQTLARAAAGLGERWAASDVASALAELAEQGVDLDPTVEQPTTLVAVIRAANLSPAERDLPGDRLVLDQDGIDAMQPVPVGVEPSNVRSVDEIAKELTHGPVTLNGPEQHWCIQAIAVGSERYVRIEILDPVHWQNGPALPDAQLVVARELGFLAEEGMWVLEVPAQSEADLAKAAEVMVAFMDRAWG